MDSLNTPLGQSLDFPLQKRGHFQFPLQRRNEFVSDDIEYNAFYARNEDMLKMLSLKADPNQMCRCRQNHHKRYGDCVGCEKWHLLHIAVYYRHEHQIQMLLDYGADPNIRNRGGDTPLHMVKDEKIVHKLLDHGADPNLTNAEGHTPLQAIFDKKAMLALLERGADIPKETMFRTLQTQFMEETIEEFKKQNTIKNDFIKHAS